MAAFTQFGNRVSLAGTEHVALYPFWSPDSRSIAFSANGRLQKIDVIAGGAPQVICECEPAYATWNPAGTILFGARDRPIQRISAMGGRPTDVFGFDASRGETREGAPEFLPDRRHFLYSSFGKQDTACMLSSVDSRTRRYLFANSESPAFYAPNPAGGGALFYIANGQLFARAFDPDSAEFIGDAQVIADAVGDGPVWSTSENGLLAFRHTRPRRARFAWFDSDGVQLKSYQDLGNVSRPRISPDQRTIAFVRNEERNSDIWLLDVRSQATSRLISDGSEDDFPVWSFDGNQITYSSRRNADRVITQRSLNRLGPEVLVSKRPAVESKYYGVPLLSLLPTSASPDGRWIAATETYSAKYTVWLVPKDEKREPVRFVDGADGSVSPDGRWMAYASGGGRSEVFVRSMPPEAGGFPSSAGTWQISSSGGGNPVWRLDGKEIFYLAADGKLMSVAIESGETFFRPKTPKPLFQTRQLPSLFREYDVSRDGKRFLLTVRTAVDADQPVTVIVNWPKRLKK